MFRYYKYQTMGSNRFNANLWTSGRPGLNNKCEFQMSNKNIQGRERRVRVNEEESIAMEHLLDIDMERMLYATVSPFNITKENNTNKY